MSKAHEEHRIREVTNLKKELREVKDLYEREVKQHYAQRAAMLQYVSDKFGGDICIEMARAGNRAKYALEAQQLLSKEAN